MAEGEHQASAALKEASDIISQSPAALQLRFLQTINNIAYVPPRKERQMALGRRRTAQSSFLSRLILLAP